MPISNKHQYKTRSGSHSTKGSQRGVNLLGWEREEDLTKSDEWAVLRARHDYLVLEKDKARIKGDNKKSKQIGKEILEVNNKISELKKKIQGDNYSSSKSKSRRLLSNYILDLIKKDMTKPVWDRYVKKAVENLKKDDFLWITTNI